MRVRYGVGVWLTVYVGGWCTHGSRFVWWVCSI